MSSISFSHICKEYKKGQPLAVDDMNLEISDHEFVVLVGPSGCGKSTLLRMVAGLEDISSGELWIDDMLMNCLPAGDRRLAMVFQNYALYPNMTVRQNIAFGLESERDANGKRLPRKYIDGKVDHAAELLGLTNLLDRRPAQLSGGQKQRVAIGSAIVRDARAYLMDEPLSNLDAKLRAAMRVELKRLYETLNASIIYVTHDQVEAMTLATRIVIMNKGRKQQVGTPEEVYERPANQFVAEFIGSPKMNILKVRVQRSGGQLVLHGSNFDLIPEPPVAQALIERSYIDRDLVLGIRPEDITVSGSDTGALPFTYELQEDLGSYRLLYGRHEGTDDAIIARIAESETIPVTMNYKVHLRMDRIHLFDPQTGEAVLHASDYARKGDAQ